MSTLSLPSGSYRSTSFTQRLFKQWLPAVQAKADAFWASLAAPVGAEPRNADEVMSMARRYEHTDPAFAADLRAAVLHHQAAELARKALA